MANTAVDTWFAAPPPTRNLDAKQLLANGRSHDPAVRTTANGDRCRTQGATKPGQHDARATNNEEVTTTKTT